MGSRGTWIAACAALAVLAGCGTGDSSASTPSGGGPLGAEVTLVTIRNLTGAVAPYGNATLEGQQFAVDEINQSGMLGSTKLTLEVVDAATDIQQAVDATTRAARSDAAAIISPVFSTQVLSMAPIAQQARVPLVVVQAGVPGILDVGNYIFRITPPQDTLIPATVACLDAKNVASVAMIYQSYNATVTDLAENAFPRLLDDVGIGVVGNEGYPSGTTDFSATVTKALSGNPDAVGVLPSNADVASIITQLRRQGYTGTIFGQAGMGVDLLKPVSAQAEGAVWATTFAAQSVNDPDVAASTKRFIEAWQAAKGQEPNNFHAEAYDSIYMIANALQAANSSDRDDLRAALQQVAEGGMDAAMGRITFENRDARVEPVLLEWRDGAQQLAGAPC